MQANGQKNKKVITRIPTFSGEIFRQLSGLIHDMLFPLFCLGCGKYGQVLCSDCFSKIELSKTYTCFYCGRIIDTGKVCSNCRRKHRSEVERIVWATSYKDDLAKELIHEYKYMGVQAAGEILAEVLNHRAAELLTKIENPVVIPVPIHRNKFKKRGFNQAEFLARSLSERYDLRGGLALRRIRETETQVGLSKSKRVLNLAGAISCCDIGLVQGKDILLVDDVATTGTTLNECARVLRAAGAERVYAIAVARG